MSHWNCNDCPVNQWFCSDIGLCFYKMSESSSPSKTPEDEGSKSWEEWQVSLQPYMYILVVSFYLTHLLVSDWYPVCLLLYCFLHGELFCLSTPLLFSIWKNQNVILWQPVLVFHTHDVHVRCKHECSSTCRLKDKCTDNAVCMWMVWCSIPVYIYRPRQHESTDSTSDQYTNSAWLGLVVLQIVRFHIQENTDTCMSKTVIGSSN